MTPNACSGVRCLVGDDDPHGLVDHPAGAQGPAQTVGEGDLVEVLHAIVLDVAGVMPTDEMGMLMLSALARDAAENGITVALADPSPPLRDRLAQLGVHNLTFIEYEQETDRRPTSLPPPGSEESTALMGSGQPPAHTGAGIHEEALPSSTLSVPQQSVTASAGALEPASVLAARQLVDDAHQARTQAPRHRHAGTAPGPATSGDADPVVGLAEDSTRTAPNTITTISLTSAVTAQVDGRRRGLPWWRRRGCRRARA
jgi:STAS domain